MKTFLPLFVLAVAAAGFSACERKVVVVETSPATPVPEPVAETKTFETARLSGAIDRYEREPTAAHEADVKKALADLDREIAELEQRVAQRSGAERDEAAAKLANLRSYRTTQATRFGALQTKAGVAPSTSDARSGTEKVEDAANRVGRSIERAARDVGDAVKDATR